MESQEIVVHPSSVETSLSPIVLDRWQESLTEMDQHETEATALFNKARALEVKDADSFAEAGKLIAELKHTTSASEACMEPYKLKVRKVLDFIQQRFNRNKNRAEEARGVLNMKMGDYSRKEREAAEAEQRKLNEEAQRRRDAELKAQVKAGEINKRKAAELAKEPTPEVRVQPNLPKTTGVRQTTNYPITIGDPKELIRAMLKAYKKTDTKRVQFLAQFVVLNESELAGYAKKLKDPEQFNKEIPGVTCEARDAFGGKV